MIEEHYGKYGSFELTSVVQVLIYVFLSIYLSTYISIYISIYTKEYYGKYGSFELTSVVHCTGSNIYMRCCTQMEIQSDI